MKKRVQIYRNLHKPGHFSIISMEKENYGRKISESIVVKLTDAEFVVQKGGRDRAVREKRRNVHAFIRGYWDEDFSVKIETSLDEEREMCRALQSFDKVSYNPFNAAYFYRKSDGSPVLGKVPVVIAHGTGAFISGE